MFKSLIFMVLVNKSERCLLVIFSGRPNNFEQVSPNAFDYLDHEGNFVSLGDVKRKNNKVQILVCFI